MHFRFIFSILFPYLTCLSIPREEIRLWSSIAPGEVKGEIKEEIQIPPKDKLDVMRVTNVSIPTIKVFPAEPSVANGTAIIVCPGGAYNILAYEHEGTDVCNWLNDIGITAILLKYRVPRRKGRPKHEAPLQDAQRAISLLRKDAKRWNIEADRIGILGFSAGGNLAVMASTSFKKRTYKRIDSVDEISCRPDFAILIYPAYLLDRKKRDKLFDEIKITSDCPPCFLAHTGDDHVPAEGSALFYLALEGAGVVGSELHLYPFGGHGYGIRGSKNSVSSWPSRARDWMNSMGWLNL